MLERVEEVFFVIEDRVVDRGTHDELVARSPRYRQIVLREDT
jgi:ABC-type multidrug transport system fused ATPase/permease subunit